MITEQLCLYMPRKLRKHVTHISIFKSKSIAEWTSIAQEFLHSSKKDGITLHNYVILVLMCLIHALISMLRLSRARYTKNKQKSQLNH